MFEQSKRTLPLLAAAVTVTLTWSAVSLSAPPSGKGKPPKGDGDTTPPAAVDTLVVVSVTSSSIELGWIAVADDTGDPAAAYDIRYSTTPILTDEDFDNASLVICDPVPAAPGQPEIVTVGDLSELTIYDFALKVADAAGSWSALSNVIIVMTNVTPSGEWALEVVDPLAGPGSFSGFSGLLALAYDALGNPSIAYQNSEILPNGAIHAPVRLASWNGTGWEIELIENLFGSGVDLAYDPKTGEATIAYLRDEPLKFFRRDATTGTWNSELVTTVGVHPDWGGGVSLAYDGGGNPSIAFQVISSDIPGDGMLKFACWDGSSWVIEEVDACPGCGEGKSLAYDAGGTAYISYTVFDARLVKLARRIGPNDWQIEIVTGCVAASPISLKFNPLGSPSVGYSDYVNEKLKFAASSP